MYFISAGEPEDLRRRAAALEHPNEVAVFREDDGVRRSRRLKDDVVGGIPKLQIANRDGCPCQALSKPGRKVWR